MSKQSDGNQPGAPKSAPDRSINLSKIARQKGEDGKTVAQNWLDIAARMRTPELAEGQENMVSQVRRHAREAENQPGQQDLVAKLLTTRFADPQRRVEPARPEGMQEEGKQQANHFQRREEAARPQRREGAAQQSLSERVKASLDKIADPKGPAR